VLSPLLNNIALDGKLIDKKKDRRKSIIFVRCVDDFVVINHNLSVIQKCKKIINEFLAGKGLELNDTKTEMVHTRIAFEKNEFSFEFLGFKIKHFNVKKHSAKNNQGHNFGF